jgi:hypothetical protein
MMIFSGLLESLMVRFYKIFTPSKDAWKDHAWKNLGIGLK